LESSAANRIAKSSRATPRIANRLVRSVRDFAHVAGTSSIDLTSAESTLTALEIDDDGLDATDRRLLQVIIEQFQGGPVGLSNLAAVLSEEEDTVEDVVEPYLLQNAYIQRTPKGRCALPNFK
jgi:Holliday junction DNA helicase RuvB